MCGFSGFICSSLSSDEGADILSIMGKELFTRGPDQEGIWQSEDATVGVVHRRLEVVGLGPTGHQPMVSSSGRYVLAFNGEIYNHRALRVELERFGINFRGQSDTEILLVALENWGTERTLKRCVGMFAFAFWDRKAQKLVLARDRFGEKPLYYGWQGRSFLFSSTLNALRKHPDWKGVLNRNAFSQLLSFNYIPAPQSIYEGIYKLMPGTWYELEWKNGDWQESENTYWSAVHEANKAGETPFSGDLEEASDFLEDLIRNTLKGQMISDVPLGAFLSGGIDSSTVIALMQLEAAQSVQTFTIGFEDQNYSEASAAEAVAKHLGTKHTTYSFCENDVINLIPQMPYIYDEPFADASQLPSSLVSQIAKQEVTVALTGDGGDEIFGGYNRYVYGEFVHRLQKNTPLFARQVLGKGITAISPSAWDSFFQFVPSSRRFRQSGEKLHKLAGLLSAKNEAEIYELMTRFWLNGLPLEKSDRDLMGPNENVWSSSYTFQEKMMLADTLGYLADDILVKVDRSAMGFSLETRAPFLDHRIFEFMWSLPVSYRVSRTQGKVVLRNVLNRYVPKNLIDRPKTGFALPLGDYLRGPLRDWAESLLSLEQLNKECHFDSTVVRSMWEQHLSGKVNRQYDLWSILMFQSWLDT